MQLKVLYSGVWTVVAPLDTDGSCPVDDELAAISSDPKLQSAAIGFRVAWSRIPLIGPKALGTALYHCVDEDHGIYEFVKGPMRLLCFEAGGRLVVCSHALRKKTQKTPRADKKRAIRLKDRYLAALRAGEITVVDDDQE